VTALETLHGDRAATIAYGTQYRELAGHAASSTNNRMELQAAIEALRALKKNLRCRVPHRSRDLTTRWREKLPTGQRWGKSYPQDRYKSYPQDGAKSYPVIISQGSRACWWAGGPVGGQADLLADSQ
jgi:RNase H